MAADDDPFDAISGATGLTGAVDTGMILKKDRTGRDNFVKCSRNIP